MLTNQIWPTTYFCTSGLRMDFMGHLGGSVVEHLPLAQGLILESWDRVPHRVRLKESASPSAYVSVSLCVSLVNK